MIEHVRRRAMLSKVVSEIYVATCDQEIADVVRGYGGNVIMTPNTHKNGTSRVAEVIKSIDCSHVILLQGDEPLLLPRHLDSVANAILADPKVDAWNATGSIADEEELDRHSFVKCAVGNADRILYCFRRSPCYSEFEKQKQYIRKILGIIAYRKDFLLELTMLESKIEQYEFIEQMCIIENGYTIKSIPVEPSLPGVNEPVETDIVLSYILNNQEQSVLLKNILRNSD